MDNFESNNNKGYSFKKIGKILIYAVVLTVAFLGGGAAYKYYSEGSDQQDYRDKDIAPVAAQGTPFDLSTMPLQNTTPTPKVLSTPTPLPSPTIKPKLSQRQKILEEMHKMANSKVVADFIWGEIPITEEGVEKLIAEINETKFTDKGKLLTILENWKSGDFSNAVNEHNYIWEQLGGSLGKATTLRSLQ